MIADELLIEIEVLQQPTRVPRILASDNIDSGKGLQRPVRNVPEISDGGANKEKDARHLVILEADADQAQGICGFGIRLKGDSECGLMKRRGS